MARMRGGRALRPRVKLVMTLYLVAARIGGVCPSIRFLDPPPPPINFVHDDLFFSKFNIIYFLLFRVRLSSDNFWAERCGHGLG